MLKSLIPFMGGNSKEDNDDTDDKDKIEGERVNDIPERDIQDLTLVAPSIFAEEPSYVQSGEEFVQTLFILNWPDDPEPLYIDNLLYNSPVKTDISIHVHPRQKDKALKDIERKYKKAESQANQSSVTNIGQESRQRRLQYTKRVYDSLKDTDANLFDISMYITVRADDPEELELAVETIARELRTQSLYPEALKNKQLYAMQSASPIGKNIVNQKQPAVSGAIGLMYPFSTTTVTEKGGIDMGTHAINNSPVTINRFARENGYNQITAGKIGSGKTFGSILEILRMKAAYGDDLIIYLLDPLDGFKPVSTLLDGKEILVGGNVDINPMRIVGQDKEKIQEIDDMENPLEQKIQKLIDFFEMFFNLQNREIGESRDILIMAIEKTYRDAGITEDIDTHSKESPTPLDLLRLIEDMAENPKEYTNVQSEEVIRKIEEHASRLALSLSAFDEGGRYANLGRKSDLELENEDVVYFNLSQQEGTGELGLMMHLLLGEVYEQAKETDKKVLFAIDEAHYIMSDAKSLNFLEQVVRHSRHYDLGINFITQTLEEFFAHEQSNVIAQQCSIRKLHKIESGLTEEIKETLSLEESHIEFIKNAAAGEEELGYSEALYGVDEYGYVPLRVRPSDFELNIIDNASS